MIGAFLARQREASDPAFSYLEIGASRHNAEHPRGYDLDHNRVQIGRGVAQFEAACAALRAWQMFPSPWTRISPVDAPIRVGEIITLQAHVLGIWWLNACEIVYVIDELGAVRRFGFAYGTLRAHVESGEERFSVELHPDGRRLLFTGLPALPRGAEMQRPRVMTLENFLPQKAATRAAKN